MLNSQTHTHIKTHTHTTPNSISEYLSEATLKPTPKGRKIQPCAEVGKEHSGQKE